MDEIIIPGPLLQIAFYERLQGIRVRYLHEALASTITHIDVKDLDKELAEYATTKGLNILARAGVRGEVFFPIPRLLTVNPFLLGYYRLLFGFSQKEFYKAKYFGPFKGLEELGKISANASKEIPRLCRSLSALACDLIGGIDEHSLATVRDLQILTLGPQFRGSQNTTLGRNASLEVYQLFRQLLGKYVRSQTETRFEIINDSKRKVLIEFKSDPDIRVTECMPISERLLVSIEIKGGSDFSNIHNRLGEAEKSHQKAKSLGSTECWTIHRVNISANSARKASPTTTAFFNLAAIQVPDSDQGIQFREKLASVLSIRIPKGI